MNMDVNTATKSGKRHFSKVLVAAIVLVTLLASGLLGYLASNSVASGRINELQNQLSTLQGQMID